MRKKYVHLFALLVVLSISLQAETSSQYQCAAPQKLDSGIRK